MRIIVEEKKVFNFNELSQDIQDKVIEGSKVSQYDDYCDLYLKDDMEEKAKELLKKYFGKKATFKKVLYDLSYCQGSGAMIEFDLLYYGQDIEVVNSGMYTHERSFTTYFVNLSDTRYKQLTDKIVSMNIELGKYGYDLLEDCNDSNTTIISELSTNEYYEDGTLYE